jgi:small-conductance mechanosensitive channel
LLANLFNAPVTSDEDHPVTVGTLLVLLLYVIAGGIAAYGVTRVLSRYILPRLGLQRGTVAAIRSILFYTLCAMFGVVSFQLLHVPMAAFAFLGGAAAIAVGFGSQDIMNNFMSGLILLTEQPIRAGDIVDIGGTQGVVLHIGLRSTRLRTEYDHELIVPNKALIDEQVTNFTLSDNLVRLSVAATLDRDLDIERAKWEMLEIAFSNPMIIKSPRPVVFLKEVDTYWLVFEVHFWVQYSSFIKSSLVQSEILEAIGARFPPQEEKDDKDDQDKPAGGPTPPEASSSTAALASIQKMGKAAVAKEVRRMKGSFKSAP